MNKRRKLREENLRLNRSDPIPEEPQPGGIGERDPNTGEYRTELDNGGSYPVERLFDGSVGAGADVQLNPNTRTADYYSAPEAEDTVEAAKLEGRIAATGVPNPDNQDEDGDNDPDNENFGNCGVCNNKSIRKLNCDTGEAEIVFGDLSTERIRTPAELEYGAKVNFNYTSGGSGSIYIDACESVQIVDDTEDLGDRESVEVYGELIYQQRATNVTIGTATGSGLKEFQLYRDGCTVTVIGVSPDNIKSNLGTASCSELGGTYGSVEPQTCVKVGDQKACGIDPNSLSYDCVVRGYRLCQKYRVSWVLASSGQRTYVEECDPVGYKVITDPIEEPYKPGARNVGTGFLDYDSGIPRRFTVNDEFSSGDFGYFQIYSAIGDPCSVEVVGVKVTGSTQAFSGASVTKEYETIYQGGCGFEIELGTYLADSFLKIYNYLGEVILETSDFIPSSIEGCKYIGMNGERAKFEVGCSNRSPDIERVEVFEKIVSSDVPGGTAIQSSYCVS